MIGKAVVSMRCDGRIGEKKDELCRAAQVVTLPALDMTDPQIRNWLRALYKNWFVGERLCFCPSCIPVEASQQRAETLALEVKA